MFEAPSNFKTNPTQGNFILDFIKSNPELQNTSSKVIAELLPKFVSKKIPDGKKLSYETVRARLSEFQKLNIVSNDDGQFSFTENWFKKILKTGQTKNPKKETSIKIEIYTFENNDENRYDELLAGALNGLLGDLDSIDNAGYQSSSVSAFEVDKQYITNFSMDNPNGSWANLSVFDWKNKNTGRIELFE